MRVGFWDAFEHALLPGLAFFGLLLSAPHALSRVILPWLGAPEPVLHTVFTYGCAAELCAIVFGAALLHAAHGVKVLHCSLRDGRYLIREELTNLSAQ